MLEDREGRLYICQLPLSDFEGFTPFGPLYTRAWEPLTRDKKIKCLIKKPYTFQVHCTQDPRGVRDQRFWTDGKIYMVSDMTPSA